jgi:TRAP-type C4-dicarboxylate transport system permease small subunit
VRPAEAGDTDTRDPLGFVLDRLDRVLVALCVVASVAAGAVLTYSVAVRHFLHWSTDWQDEVSVFLLVGATFLSAPYVQARRGHIGIEAVRGLLGPGLERVRVLAVDLVGLVFCGTFTWLCWALLLDAVESGEVTDSTWAPPLWLPYGLMTGGMTLLTLRFLAQVVADGAVLGRGRR